MISGPRSRSGVPLDEQSALPTAPGVPWWGAVLLAVGLTSVGAVIVVAGDGDALGFSFKAFYVIGCIAAVLAVRRRALFTAVAQPPLVLFGVSVITLYFLVSGEDSGLKKLIFNVALPVAKLFPLMAWTFLIVLAIAAARVWFTHPKNAGKIVKTGDRKSATSKTPKKAGAKPASRSGGKVRATGEAPRTEAIRSRDAKSARPRPRTAVVDGDAPTTPVATRPRTTPPRSSVHGGDPRPRTTEPRIAEPRATEPRLGESRGAIPRATERSEDHGNAPRRRRPIQETPEYRPRRAGTHDDPPPSPGARAYRAPVNFEYAPPPRLRDRDLR